MRQKVHQWFEDSFGEDYLLVYKHRDGQEAISEVRKIMEWLKLPSESRILDLCCGTGRHALVLADLGFRVTGVDLSSVLLREARATDSGGRVQWIRSDMRDLPFAEYELEGFDGVVNFFTSFGYFEEDNEQLKVLKQIRRALKPEGRFVIDYLNAINTADNLVPYSERTERGTVISETRSIDRDFVMKEIIVKEPNRPSRRYMERVKLYSLERMISLLENAGLVLDAVYGSYDGDSYEKLHSKRMIIVGHRI